MAAGVGILIGPRALKSLIASRKYDRGRWKLRLTVIPEQWSSTTALPMLIIKRASIPYIPSYPLLFIASKNNVLIIGRDMNAQIDKNANNNSSLHNSSNRNGEHLTDFTRENGLSCLNTKFQKRKGKLWTYTYAKNAKAQIDYILMNKKWINSALDCEAYSSFKDVSSDHRIV